MPARTWKKYNNEYSAAFRMILTASASREVAVRQFMGRVRLVEDGLSDLNAACSPPLVGGFPYPQFINLICQTLSWMLSFVENCTRSHRKYTSAVNNRSGATASSDSTKLSNRRNVLRWSAWGQVGSSVSLCINTT